MQKTLVRPRYFPNLPRIAQISSNHCGIAVAAMLLGNHGIKTTQEKVEEKSKISERKIAKYGINVPELARACKRSAKIDFWFKENTTILEVKKLLTIHKVPVGVEWQGEFEKYDNGEYGHYSVITHVNSESGLIHIADPYKHFAGRDRKIKIQRFKKLWWDVNEVKDKKTKKIKGVKDTRMIFIITSKEEIFPKSLRMKKI